MNKKLTDILYNNWLKVDTWYTAHPSDMKRFHVAIEKIALEIGMVDYDTILESMKSILANSTRNDECVIYARKASCILEYTADIQE